jgi:hypothetical protein
VPLAIGDGSEERGAISIGSATTVSSMSQKFIQATAASRRFGDVNWRTTRQVQLVTLDQLIARYGTPDFIKIDTKGYESQVLKGLFRPVRIISFEFVPELIENTFECINVLDGMGEYVFNYSLRDDDEFQLTEWVPMAAIKNILLTIDYPLWGDIYALRSPHKK